MRKTFTGVISILASAMLLMPSFTAYADEPDPSSGSSSTEFSNDSTADLKLTNATTHDKFNAYKIIDITYDPVTNTLSYSWNANFQNYINNYDSDPTTTFTVEQYRNFKAEKRRQLLAGLHEYITKNSETIHPVNASLVEAVADTPETDTTPESETGHAVFNDLEMGGYLIAAVETTDVYQLAFKAIEPTIDTSTNKYVLNNIDFSVAAKHTPMTITKTADKLSAQTNETITYSIIADVPSYGANAIAKAFSIKDIIPESITIDTSSIKVYSHESNDPAVDADGWTQMASPATYTLTTGTETDGRVNFTINIENIKDGVQQFDAWYKYTVTETKNGEGNFDITYTANKKKIKIEYEAKLNDKAVLAAKNPSSGSSTEYTVGKNTNIAALTFYPYPYVIEKESGEPKTNTVTDDFSVYTYGIELLKYGDGNNEKLLTGAKFKLYSKAIKDESDKITGVDEDSIVTGYYYRTSGSGTWTLADDSSEMETVDGRLYIKGLKSDAIYYLKETCAPVGYNLPEIPVKAISTELDKSSHLLATTKSSSNTIQGAANRGNAYIEIDNSSGFTLPSTGGTGVMILKILGVIGMGAAIVVVSIVLFAPKKKKSK